MGWVDIGALEVLAAIGFWGARECQVWACQRREWLHQDGTRTPLALGKCDPLGPGIVAVVWNTIDAAPNGERRHTRMAH